MTNHKLLYLASPIDFAGDIDLDDMVLRIGKNYNLYIPSKAFVIGREPNEKIQQVNMAALAGSDIMVAVLPRETLTYGVPFEIASALYFDIPVIVVTNILTNESALISYLHYRPDCKVVEDINELEEALKEGFKQWSCGIS